MPRTAPPNKSKSRYKYKVSFVLPVYNTEEYLAETIDSIVNQDIGFEENCQLVIVNDGSTDGSEEICFSYKDKFPNNIKYIKQKNQGVAAACNTGLGNIEGRFMSIIGSDDLLTRDAAKKVCDFFEGSGQDVDLVAIKIEYFGAITGDHPLNYKFTCSRVVDVEKEWDAILSANGGSFIKSELIKNEGMRFDESLKTGEDSEFLNRIVLKKEAYGIVEGPIYYYRKRLAKTSLADSEISSGWYFDLPSQMYLGMLEKSVKLRHIPRYTQMVVMHYLQWSIKNQRVPLMGDRLKRYRASISEVLRLIDEEVILCQRQIDPEYKIHALSIKYGRDITKALKYHADGKLYYKDLVVFNGNKQKARLEFISINKNIITIEGWYGGFKADGLRAYAEAGNDKHELKDSFRPFSDVYSLGEKIYEYNSFKVSIPLKHWMELRFFVEAGGKKIPMQLDFWRFSKLSNLKGAYKVANGYIILNTGQSLIAKKYSPGNHLKRETQYLRLLYKQRLYHLVAYRVIYYAAKSFLRKDIWIISDRPRSAGDNGEYLFHYATKYAPKSVKVYFAIEKSSARYRQIKKAGRIIPYHSFRFKIYFLLAKKRISSVFDRYIIDDFGEDGEYLRDLYNFDFIYINHGVLTSDSSRQFGRWSKNAELLTVGSEAEKQAIVSNKNYGYDKSKVKVAGLPRFDPLISKTTRTIAFMPTWRSTLAGQVLPKAKTSYDVRAYNKNFKSSEYFKFYNSLINDKKINRMLKENNYRIKFYIHPSLGEQWRDFDKSELVEVAKPPHNYIQALSEADLLVTDFSGVAFDFACMKKPIVYTQFDAHTLYQDHYYEKGAFSFEKDGFGPVVYDYGASVEAIVSAIKAGCKMPDKYQRRVDKFFYKVDHHNSQRVYEAILNMG